MNKEQLPTRSPLACDMRAIPLSEREPHLKTSRELFSRIQKVRELPDGYEFRLPDGKNLLVWIAEFISLEKLCCPFLTFTLELEAEGGPIRLSLRGREGVKAFIREEVEGLLGVVVDWDGLSDEL